MKLIMILSIYKHNVFASSLAMTSPPKMSYLFHLGWWVKDIYFMQIKSDYLDL